MDKITLKEIHYLDTFPVRSAVLRIGKPIESCFFLGDDAPDTSHFGLFTDDNLIGVASLFKTEKLRCLFMRKWDVLKKELHLKFLRLDHIF
jgi:hypothetical protein